MKKILNYINGELVEPFSGSYLENYNPSNGKVYSLILTLTNKMFCVLLIQQKMLFLLGKIHQSKKDQIC